MTLTEDLARYDAWARSHPEGSLWQSLEWKTYQEALGRETRIYALMEGEQILASTLVVIDRTAFGYSTWDIPRGPLGPRMDNEKLKMNNDWKQLLERIVADAKEDRCLTLYLSPPYQLSIINYQFSIRPSGRHEQPEATRVIDLTHSEEDILRQMKPKGRYNISVAEKNGVRVEESDDIDSFYALLKETRRRDKFSIHPKHHYEAFLKELPQSFLLLACPPSPTGRGAEGEGRPVAGLLGMIWNSRGFYYYGASSYEHRALMAPYALQWAAMRRCKAQGCTTYDLLGLAPPTVATAMVDRPAAPPDHPWQGVSAFKEKFGGTVVSYPPEQQIVLRPMTYRMLQLKRKLLG